MELLAPAGTLEKLKWAACYGADAIYFGTEFGSLRSYAGNFSVEDAVEGLSYLHRIGKKGYVTLNIYPFSDELDRIEETARTLDEAGADAFIVADLGVLTALSKMNLSAALHVSTQANTVNGQTALAYKELGARRVNLARELSLEQIQAFQEIAGKEIETEVFIHGAVCFSYSGRCAISDYMTGHQANRGACKHPCRWNYALVEEKRPGEFMPITEDERGTYLFNSKELALFEYVPALIEAGVTSCKIEGRMKSIHYIASTVSFYRQVLDGKSFTREEGLNLLNRIPNRGYSAGFISGSVSASDYQYDQDRSFSACRFVGNVTDAVIDGHSVLEIRNRIKAGETFELLTPDGETSTFVMATPLITTAGHCAEVVNNSQFVLLDEYLPPFSILRRVE